MIVVTGADGIVGRSLCRILRERNYPFLPIVRRKKEWTLDKALVVDLSEVNACQLLSTYSVSSIVHLAAAVPHSPYYPDNAASANKTRKIDQNIAQLKTERDIPLIYMSTCGLYDRSISKVKTEDDTALIKIESDYFSAKLDGEALFSQLPESTILRLAAPVGPGLKDTVVLSKFIRAAIAEIPIQLWGTGSREQNFIDVLDVAELILKIVNKPSSCLLNVAFEAVSMKNLAEIVVGLVGKGSVMFAPHEDPREGETARYSINKAKMLYNWTPEISIIDSCEFLLNNEFK